MAAKKQEESVLEVPRLDVESLQVRIVGTSPLILHRMSQKASNELLLPKGRKTAADKAANLKHNPIEEFRASAYLLPSGPTLLGFMASALKKAIMTAALDLPGMKKSQIGRLLWVEEQFVPIWGEPLLFMSVVRSSDINRTPDIRTRAIVPEWCTEFRVSYVRPLLTAQAVANLISAAGSVAGIGDWRPEKGAGNYGQFALVTDETERVFEKIQNLGREAQQRALDEPQPYDDESAELLSWFVGEAQRRGFTLS